MISKPDLCFGLSMIIYRFQFFFTHQLIHSRDFLCGLSVMLISNVEQQT